MLPKPKPKYEPNAAPIAVSAKVEYTLDIRLVFTCPRCKTDNRHDLGELSCDHCHQVVRIGKLV